MTSKLIKKIVSFVVALGIVLGFTYTGIQLFFESGKYYRNFNPYEELDSKGDEKCIQLTDNPIYSSSVEDYLLENIDTQIVNLGKDSLAQQDAIRVKQVFVDKTKLEFDVTCADDYWNNQEDYEGYMKMNETVQILYDPGVNSSYLVGLINTLSSDSSVSFTRSNMLGEKLDGCIYDSKTGIAYISKNAINNDGIASVQAEVFYLCDGDMPSNNADITVTSDSIESIDKKGIVELNSTDNLVRIKIADEDYKEEIQSDYINLYLNDHPVDSKYFTYSPKSGSLYINYPSSGICNIDVEVNKPSIFERIGNFFLHMWDDPTVNAGTFDEMNVASSAWTASGGAPLSGTVFTIDGVSVEYGDYTADGKTYIPTSERYLSDSDLANMASIITNGSAGSIGGEYFAAGNFQVYKVTIPEKTLTSGGITYHIPASTYYLHCSHSTANAISGTPNMDPGKVMVNIMATTNGFALIGMFTEFPGYTQEGVGYFKIPFVTDSTASSHVDVNKMYDGRNVPNAIFAFVPDSYSDNGGYGVGAMNNVKNFVRSVYSQAGVSHPEAMSQWEADIFYCRGESPSVAGVVKTMFTALFPAYTHKEQLPDGTTSLRFNSKSDADYVIGILINSLNTAYGYEQMGGWSYTSTFPTNSDLDVYKAIEDVLYAPSFHTDTRVDILYNFYVPSDITLLVTDKSGKAGLDLYLGSYIPNSSSTIKKGYKYREIFGGVDSGKIDDEVYKLEVTFTSYQGGTNTTFKITDSSGKLVKETTGASANLVNTLGASRNAFVNMKDDKYVPASVSISKTGQAYTSVQTQQVVINGKTYVVNTPQMSSIKLSGAHYKISCGNSVYNMTTKDDVHSYNNLTTLNGRTTVYKIYEDKAPSGYSVSSEYWEVSVNRMHAIEDDMNVYTDFVVNVKYYGSNPNGKNMVAYDEIKPVKISVNKSFDKVIGTDKSVNYEEEIKKCVFGLYTSEKITLSGGKVIEAGTLVGVTGISSTEGKGSAITGHASFNSVPDGKYYVKEIDGSSRFVKDTNKYNVTVNRSNSTEYSVNVTNKTGSISVKKSKPAKDLFDITEVVFYLYNNNGDLLSTGTTNSDGSVSWDNSVSSLAMGKYKIIETWKSNDFVVTNDSDWYRIDDTSYGYDFTLSDKEDSRSLTFNVVNNQQSAKLKVIKNILVNGDKADITFELVNSGEVIATGTCSTDGDVNKDYSVSWNYKEEDNLEELLLSTGVYELREYISSEYTYLPPEGFSLSSNGEYFYKTIELYDSDEVTTQYVKNTRCDADLEIRKESETNEIEGVKFTVYYLGNGDVPCDNMDRKIIRASSEYASFETDANGLIYISNLPFGWYEIEERTPSGNELTWDGELSINGNRLVRLTSTESHVVTHVSAHNAISVSLRVDKKDLWTLQAVGGASFTLYKDINENGVIDLDEKETGVTICDEDKDGIVEFNSLGSGKYILKESSTVEGYYISSEEYLITIDSRNDVSVQVNEKPYAVSILINKVDYDDSGNYLSGAKFSLYEDINHNNKYDEDIDVSAVTYGDKDGTTKAAIIREVNLDGKPVYLSDPVKPGSYLICETETPYGYELVGSAITPVKIESKDTEANGFEVKPYEVTIKNICRGSIRITKIDEEYPDNKLSGAEFTMYKDVNSNMKLDKKDTKVGLFVEEADGEYYVHDVPYGTYLIKETKSPDGFLIRDDVWVVDIKENGVTYEVQDSDFEGIANQFSGSVNLYKMEIDDKNEYKPVTGAIFEVYTEDGTVVDVLTDKGDGSYTLSGLVKGNYYLIEKEAPVGYVKDKGMYPFEITYTNYDVVVDNSSAYGVKGIFVEQKPSIGTTLTNDKDKTKVVPYNSVVNLTDEVHYEGLIPGSTYVVKGILVNKSNGKAVEGLDEVSVSFTPTNSNGVINVPFRLDTSKIEGTDVVAFEKLYLEGELIADHSDINNSNQTVSVAKPHTPSTGEDSSIVYYSIIGAIAVIGAAVLVGYVSMVRSMGKKDEKCE